VTQEAPPDPIAELKRLEAAAVPGPWRSTPHEAECVEVYAPTPFKAHRHCDCFDCRDEQTDHGCLCGSRKWPCPQAIAAILMMMWPEHSDEKTRAAEVMWYNTADFIAAVRTRFLPLLEFFEQERERHQKTDRLLSCSLCGDSTFDHACDDERVACCTCGYPKWPCPRFAAAEKTLEALR
jgi:ribosomal protein S27AE